jgi:hypothetical protein
VNMENPAGQLLALTAAAAPRRPEPRQCSADGDSASPQ